MGWCVFYGGVWVVVNGKQRGTRASVFLHALGGFMYHS